MNEYEEAEKISRMALVHQMSLSEAKRAYRRIHNDEPLLSGDECVKLAQESPWSLNEVKCCFYDMPNSIYSEGVRLRRAGRRMKNALVSAEDLNSALQVLGSAIKKVPFLQLNEIREMRLNALKAEHGISRFFMTEYYRWLFL